MKKISILIFFASILLLGSCSSNQVRGDDFRARWMQENYYDNDIKSETPPIDKSLTYKVIFNVLVAEKNYQGDDFNKERRLRHPNLKLKILKSHMNTLNVCESQNSLTLRCEYPLRLKRNEIINLRLVNRIFNTGGASYSSKYTNDHQSGTITEKPLSQLDFPFEGQGKYLKQSGAATFVITFEQID